MCCRLNRRISCSPFLWPPLRLDKFGLSKTTFFQGRPIFRPPHGLAMVISQSHRQVNVSVPIVVHIVLLYMYTSNLEAPKSMSGQCLCPNRRVHFIILYTPNLEASCAHCIIGHTTNLEAPKSISGQCHCQAVACCVVGTKQLKVRLINKITGILASKFKRRRFVAMDSPQKGNDDFDRSLSLFSLSRTAGEHDDDN